MVPVLKSRAAHTEELRRIPDETVQDLRAAGLNRIGAEPVRRPGRSRRLGFPGGRGIGPGLSFFVLVLLSLGGQRLHGRILASTSARGAIC